MATKHTVEQGETVVTIAHKYGFRDWKAIYYHPQNASLKQARPNPDVLNPGDMIYIPDKEPPEYDCVTNQRHRFEVKSLRAAIRVHLQDPFGVPYNDARYKLEVEGKTVEGRLEKGELHYEVLPTTREAALTLWPDDNDPNRSLHWVLQLGHLDMSETIAGIKGRLNNLGFHCSVESSEIDATTVDAIKAFQCAAGLPATGQLDDKTRDRLEAKHIS